MERLRYYFKSVRWFEIAVRMGAPVIAILIALPAFNLVTGFKALHAFIAFFLLWAHGYAFNEWGGYSFDKLDASKAKTPLLAGYVSSNEFLILSITFAAISVVLYAMLDMKFLIIVFFDIIMGILYVHPKILLKNLPIASFVILFIVSVNDFLLGWIVFSPSITQGLLIGIYFGLLGITGQHFHEAGDCDSDKKANIRTNAVRFGKKNIFIIGFIFYTLSCIYFILLSLLQIIPRYLYSVLLITYPIYSVIFYKCLRSSMGSSDIHCFVKRYRQLYGFIGLCFIILLFFGI